MDALTVSELCLRVKSVLRAEPGLQDIWVEGEVSNARPAASGHWYWTIKDAAGSFKCVMWKAVALNQMTLPADGMAFRFHGKVGLYERGGEVQLDVDFVEPAGQGDLWQAFERLRRQLEAEGLFDEARKRPLPPYPMRIGVVTSPQAAALRDVAQTIQRRWPCATVLVAPTRVQGAEAPAEIVAALTAIARAAVDVVLVVRGGGSIEDLWAFNDEAVARAIAACPVPTVSGVGHETDFTIADFVADLRMPTPTAAAERVTPDAADLRQAVDDLTDRLARQLGWRQDTAGSGLASLTHRLALVSPARTVADRHARVDANRARLKRALAGRLTVANAHLDGHRQRLEALSPTAILRRGFAHVTHISDGRTVRRPSDVKGGDGLRIRLADGDVRAVVQGQTRLFE
ncbi:MAG: exodeoxyribonuclease VII large subunit [Ardenticatenales bacterium]|nr:exodeoxyribonuclease VII large subunit [Ardenticatenales bacterium]